jgi:hypothetical protein
MWDSSRSCVSSSGDSELGNLAIDGHCGIELQETLQLPPSSHQTL